jgi:hypothetical protein
MDSPSPVLARAIPPGVDWIDAYKNFPGFKIPSGSSAFLTV